MKNISFPIIILLVLHTTNNPWKYCTKSNMYHAGYHHVSMNVCNKRAELKNKQSICSCSDDQLSIDALYKGCFQAIKKLALTKEALAKKLADIK